MSQTHDDKHNQNAQRTRVYGKYSKLKYIDMNIGLIVDLYSSIVNSSSPHFTVVF